MQTAYTLVEPVTLVDSEDTDEGHTFEPMPALVVTIGGEELPLVIGEKADGSGLFMQVIAGALN